MYFDFLVQIPEVKGKIYEKTIKGVTYINYEYDRIYKPEKKYNIPKRTTIGKKCDENPTMMYPNPNFLTYFPDTELPSERECNDRSSCIRVGAYIVIQKLIMESMVDRIIDDIYKDERGKGLNKLVRLLTKWTCTHKLLTLRLQLLLVIGSSC